MKELDEIFVLEGLFASMKGHLYLTTEHLDNPEGQVEIPLIVIGCYF